MRGSDHPGARWLLALLELQLETMMLSNVRILRLLEECDRTDRNPDPVRRTLHTDEIRWLLGVPTGADYAAIDRMIQETTDRET